MCVLNRILLMLTEYFDNNRYMGITSSMGWMFIVDLKKYAMSQFWYLECCDSPAFTRSNVYSDILQIYFSCRFFLR